MKQVQTEIEIHASPQTVWKILVEELDKYPEWNPFIRMIFKMDPYTKQPSETQEISMGDTLHVAIHPPPDHKEWVFEPRVLVMDPNKEFRWRGKFGFETLFAGEHIFVLEEKKGGETSVGSTLFKHSEQFTGWLVPLAWTESSQENTKKGFESMNEALKERAESVAKGM